MSLNKVLGNAPSIAEFFKQHENPKDAWEALWQSNTTPWDRGAHNPALEDALLQKKEILGTAAVDVYHGQQKESRRKKALVPGCGRGFDVFLLAEFGYDAYGLETSSTAVEECYKMAERVKDSLVARDAEIGVGKYSFVQGDFFKDDWLERAGVSAGDFDLIYDYTFFCALNPSFRPQWALRHSQLLGPPPQGNLICLEFPVQKDPPTSGPPYASPPEAYLAHLSHPGEDVPYDENGYVKTNPKREVSPNGLERVAHWQPERTHEVGMDEQGKVQDWVSIWRRRENGRSSAA